jgi:hypothetical protein
MFLGFPVPRARIADMISTDAPPTLHNENHESGGKDEMDCTGLVGAGGIAFPFDDIYFTSFFEGSDGYEPSFVGTGYNGASGWGLYLCTGGTVNSQAKCYKTAYQINPALTWDKKRQIDIHTYCESMADKTAKIWIITGNKDTARHIGFYIYDGILYGSVGNGASHTTVELETLGAAAWSFTKSCRAKWTPGSKAEFYVDGVKLGEITSGLPSGATNAEQILYMKIETGLRMMQSFWAEKRRLK